MEVSGSKIPKIVDLHGRLRDPFTGNPLPDGQEGPDSIFHVPSSDRPKPDYLIYTSTGTIPFSQFMQTLRNQGFDGQNIYMHITPRPEDVDRIPSPPPASPDDTRDSDYQYALGRFHRTKCNYCWAIIKKKERENGFRLSEILGAAKAGCSTCGVIYKGITRFGDLLFPKYDISKVRLRQKDNGRSQLLSETRTVDVIFSEYGTTIVQLSFMGSCRSIPLHE
jgi:hypothetical protein